MPRTLIRPLLAALVLGLWWLLVLGWAARVSPGDPWLASEPLVRSGSSAQSIFGEATITGDGLRVEALGAQALGLQSWKFPARIRASELNVLRYRFIDFPRGMELAMIFRRADQREDVISISLPWPGAGSAAVDLGQVPQWQGEILELGFSEYAKPQFPGLNSFAPFTLGEMRLEQRSWCGLLRALFSDWFAYLPWSQRSINALGRDARVPQPRPMTPVLAIGLTGSWLLLWAIFGVRIRGRSLRLVMGVAALGWLLLDARWMWILAQRQVATHAVYGGQTWDQRKSLQADSDLMQFAARVRALVQGMPSAQRVLLWSASSYDEGRLAYHLRPLNVAELYPGTNVQTPSTGMLLVIDDSDGQWHYAADAGELRGPSWQFHAHRVFEHDGLGLYRLDAGAAP